MITEKKVYRNVKNKESNARTYANSFPEVFVRGDGEFLEDENGKQYIDMLNGAGALALGHNNKGQLELVKKFLDSGAILHGLDLTTPTKATFIEKLFSCFPEEMQDYKIQFCGPTGSDAVDAAIKLFKMYTNRENVVVFSGSYHGVGQSTLALTSDLNVRKNIKSLMPNVHYLPYPYYYRTKMNQDEETYIETLVNLIEEMLDDVNGGINKPAAMIMEIVQGEGGCIPAPTKFVKEIRRITKQLDIPLIIDEVQTGLGRTGNMFAFEGAGIIPDAVVLSKAIGGGFPLSVVVYDKKYDTWESGSHAGTFRGNQLAMLAGTYVIDYINDHNLCKESLEKGNYIREKLELLKENFKLIGDVRVKGLMIGIELTLNKYNCADVSINQVSKIVKRKCFEKGVIFESGGRNNSVLRMLPALTISYTSIDRVIEVMKEVIEEIDMSIRKGNINEEIC